MQKNYHTRVEQNKVGRPQKPETPPETKEPELGYVPQLGIRCPSCGRSIFPKTEYTWKTSDGKRTACNCPQCGKRFVMERNKDGKTVIRLK